MNIKIIGAGMAGLLCANMLAHRRPLVIEAQPQLPNNHSAVLRFRSSIVGDALNIPFKKVTMVKDVLPWKNPVADALAYSFKNTGVRRTDRSVMDGRVVGERWIAPPDLIQQMAERVQIKFGETFNFEEGDSDAIISTIPMSKLMGVLECPLFPKFKSLPGLNITARIKDCDAYCSLLVPSPDYGFSRISITGDELIIEVPNYQSTKFDDKIVESNVAAAAMILGIDEQDTFSISHSAQQYAKILPIDDRIRKEFMHWATDKFNIFSLGRYATWRPGLLLDDLVNDIRLIDRWIGDRYSVARHR